MGAAEIEIEIETHRSLRLSISTAPIVCTQHTQATRRVVYRENRTTIAWGAWMACESQSAETAARLCVFIEGGKEGGNSVICVSWPADLLSLSSLFCPSLMCRPHRYTQVGRSGDFADSHLPSHRPIYTHTCSPVHNIHECVCVCGRRPSGCPLYLSSPHFRCPWPVFTPHRQSTLIHTPINALLFSLSP